MSFQPFLVEQKAKIETGVTAGLRQIRADAPLMLELNVRPWQLTFHLDWTAGTILAVLLGADEDHGVIRLKADPSGTALCRERNGGAGQHRRKYLNISLGRVGRFVSRPEPTQWCQCELVDDGWVEIVLPAWADETKPKPRAAVQQPAKPTVPPNAARQGAERLGGILAKSVG